MISFRNVWVVFKKEFLILIRDKTILFTNFLLPLFGLPLYGILAFELANYTVIKTQKKYNPPEAVFELTYQGEFPKNFLIELQKDPKIRLIKVEGSIKKETLTDFKEKKKNHSQLRSQKFNLGAKMQMSKVSLEDLEKSLEVARKVFNEAKGTLIKQAAPSGKQLHLIIFKNEAKWDAFYVYDVDNKTALAAYNHVHKKIQDLETKLVSENIKKQGLSGELLHPLYHEDLHYSSENNLGIKILGMAIGGGIMFLLLIAIYTPSLNATIGERDDRTYKILLMNPVSIYEIFLGKLFNVSVQGMMTLIPYTIQFVILKAWGDSLHLYDEPIDISYSKFVLLFLAIVSVAIYIASLCFLVCSFVKTKNQAQSLLTGMMLVITIPLIIMGQLEIVLSPTSAMIPMINFPLITENLLSLKPDYLNIGLAILANLGAALGFVWLSLGAFTVQWKDSADSKSVSDILTSKGRKTSRLMPAHAYIAFALCLFGYLYGSSFITLLKVPFFTFFLPPILFCIGTAFGIILYSDMDLAKVFKWGPASGMSLLRLYTSIVFLSLAIHLILHDLPIGEMFSITLPSLFGQNGASDFLGYFFLLALLPGFAEEVLFRGIIFNGLRQQYSFLLSALISSLFFAVIHFSIFKSGHTLIVGLILAYAYEKRGLWAAIISHIIFNATGLLLAMTGGGTVVVQTLSGSYRSIFVMIIMGLILVLMKSVSNEKASD